MDEDKRRTDGWHPSYYYPDVLSYLDRIPICVQYELDGKRTDEFPFPAALQRAKPVIEYVDGWQCNISGVRTWEDLPQKAKDYINMIENAVCCPIAYVSVGPERKAYIERFRADNHFCTEK